MRKEQSLHFLIMTRQAPDALRIEEELRKGGFIFTCLCVDSLSSFREALEESRPDAVLAAQAFASGDGFIVLSLARERFPGLPFFLIDEEFSPARAEESFKAAATDYLAREHLALLGVRVHAALESVWAREDVLRLERELQESKERFRLFYENAPVGYQALDAYGKLLEVNDAWLSMLGYERAQVIGRWFGDFLVPHERDLFRRNFARFKDSGAANGVEYQMCKGDGSVVTMALNGRIAHSPEGEFYQSHCVLYDVSSRKQMEEALKERLRESEIFTRVAIDRELRMTELKERLAALEGKLRGAGVPNKGTGNESPV